MPLKKAILRCSGREVEIEEIEGDHDHVYVYAARTIPGCPYYMSPDVLERVSGGYLRPVHIVSTDKFDIYEGDKP
jgi:hypothetical protein